jgi:cell division GTPase FtsZ
MQQALQAIENLRAVVDTLIIVSNDRWVASDRQELFMSTLPTLSNAALWMPCFVVISLP